MELQYSNNICCPRPTFWVQILLLNRTQTIDCQYVDFVTSFRPDLTSWYKNPPQEYILQDQNHTSYVYSSESSESSSFTTITSMISPLNEMGLRMRIWDWRDRDCSGCSACSMHAVLWNLISSKMTNDGIDMQMVVVVTYLNAVHGPPTTSSAPKIHCTYR